MEDKAIRIEMDCVHEHKNGHVMTCSWLNGKIQVVADFTNGRPAVLNGGRVVEQRLGAGMSIKGNSFYSL